jgi:hypothetical protein
MNSQKWKALKDPALRELFCALSSVASKCEIMEYTRPEKIDDQDRIWSDLQQISALQTKEKFAFEYFGEAKARCAGTALELWFYYRGALFLVETDVRFPVTPVYLYLRDSELPQIVALSPDMTYAIPLPIYFSFHALPTASLRLFSSSALLCPRSESTDLDCPLFSEFTTLDWHRLEDPRLTQLLCMLSPLAESARVMIRRVYARSLGCLQDMENRKHKILQFLQTARLVSTVGTLCYSASSTESLFVLSLEHEPELEIVLTLQGFGKWEQIFGPIAKYDSRRTVECSAEMLVQHFSSN